MHPKFGPLITTYFMSLRRLFLPIYTKYRYSQWCLLLVHFTLCSFASEMQSLCLCQKLYSPFTISLNASTTQIQTVTIWAIKSHFEGICCEFCQDPDPHARKKGLEHALFIFMDTMIYTYTHNCENVKLTQNICLVDDLLAFIEQLCGSW